MLAHPWAAAAGSSRSPCARAWRAGEERLPTAAFALASALVLLGAQAALGFSTRSVRFFGTGGDPAVDRIKVRVDPPTPADVGAGDFTVELWLRGSLTENETPQSGYRDPAVAEMAAGDWIYGNIFIDRDIFGSPSPDWGMSIHRNAPGGNRGVLRFGTGEEHTLQGQRQVLDDAWHHVAFVRDRASGVKRIYVDGVLDVQSAAGASTGNLSYPDGRPTSNPDSDPFLVFAGEKHGYPGTSAFPSSPGAGPTSPRRGRRRWRRTRPAWCSTSGWRKGADPS
jgi:hypothetical protein